MSIIYCIECTINGKKYIGKTSRTLVQRISQHIYSCKSTKYKHASILYRAVRKYGWHKFKWYTIEVVDSSLVDTRERYYIDMYGDYNIAKGGRGSNTGRYKAGKDAFNYKVVDEHVATCIVKDYIDEQSIDDLHIKYNFSREKISSILRDSNIKIRSNHTYRSKERIRNSRRGSTCSQVTRLKMSRAASLRSKGINNNSWQGTWITPVGKFLLLADAAAANGISEPVISKLCKNSHEPLNIHMIKLNTTLQRLNAVPGALPATIGFGFNRKDSH